MRQKHDGMVYSQLKIRHTNDTRNNIPMTRGTFHDPLAVQRKSVRRNVQNKAAKTQTKLPTPLSKFKLLSFRLQPAHINQKTEINKLWHSTQRRYEMFSFQGL
jgi:hypothetical protein